MTDTTTPAGAGARFTLTFSATGAIAGLVLINQGLYTLQPTSPNTVTVAATTATIATGGSGYKVGDTLTVQGGTASPATELTELEGYLDRCAR